MPSREQVRELLDRGLGYEAAGRRLDIPAGLAFMIATGTPADGGEGVASEGHGLKGSSQDLVNPPAVNPTRNEEVLEWVRARAAGDPKQAE